MEQDFREIAHSGGQITISIRTDAEGRRSYQTSFRHCRPTPVALTGVYAIPQGIAVSRLDLGGIGQLVNPPPFPGCYQVLIQSDSHGRFGHHCPRCDGYWRSGPFPNLCPYCATHADSYQFLSKAQQRFVIHFCDALTAALDSEQDGETTIDMDAVADAVNQDPAERPAFYVSEESQQHKFRCKACDEFNDILGRFGYCSLCGTRNDLTEFEDVTVLAIRDRLNGGAPPQNCVRDAVAAFDTFCAQYGKQLAAHSPLTRRRVVRLTEHSYHDLDEVCAIFREWFDIDLCHGMKGPEVAATRRMFFRRHVYEHNGGEVDQKYLDKGGDATVRLKQVIRETKEGAHDLVGSLVKMARNLHSGFHELLEVEEAPIRAFDAKKKRMAQRD